MTQLTAQDIKTFLQTNPHFVAQNPQIFMPPPEFDKGRGVVDFQQFVLSKIQDQVQATQNKQTAKEQYILAASRANLTTQARMQGAVVRMLDAQNFAEFVEIVCHELLFMLNMDAIVLGIETDGTEQPQLHSSGVRILAKGAVDNYLDDLDVRLEPNTKPLPDIFGENAGVIKSYAMLRLNISPMAPDGLLVFGHRDEGFFTPHQGHDLISFMADVTERLFRIWLQHG